MDPSSSRISGAYLMGAITTVGAGPPARQSASDKAWSTGCPRRSRRAPRRHRAALRIFVVRYYPRKQSLERTCRVVAFEPVAAIAAIRRTGFMEYAAGLRITPP